LSIEIPESKNLEKDEFFLNPDININIVKELEEQINMQTKALQKI
jgi:hypothetical protein